MAPIRQTSFAGGEWDPRLHQRPDLQKYGTALKLCRNFFISRQGQALTRAGTEFCSLTKYANQFTASPAQARLIPFVVSNVLSYVLEFGEQYVRVWKNGAVLSVLVSTPYAYADLSRLKYAQSGDVLFIALRGYPPATLTRLSETSWTYSAMSFSRPTVQFPTGFHGGDSVFLDSGVYGTSGTDASHPGAAWRWGYTQMSLNSDGSLTESLLYEIKHTGTTISPYTQSALTDGQVIAVYPDRPQKIVIGLRVNAIPIYRFYRGQGGSWGWIGDCDGFNFMDLGKEPDFTKQPPLGLNPLQVLNPDGSVASTETPTTVTFFEDRLIFGGTDGRPTTILGSATSDYFNFDSRLYPIKSEAVQFTLASRKREEIHSLAPITKMLSFTDADCWAVSGASTGAGSAPLSFDSVDAKAQVGVGANWVDPVVVDGVALFARTMGTGLRALGYDFQSQSFENRDVSILASHLFEEHTIIDMAYCEDPWEIVWVLRDDGVLLSFTYVKAQDVWAWAQHDVGDPVLSICSIPENGEHVLYVVVDRGPSAVQAETRMITVERMKSRKLDFEKDDSGNFTSQPWCLDSARSVQTADISTFKLVNLPWLINRTVWALADGVVYGPFTTDVSGDAYDLPAALINSKQIIFGVSYDADLQQLEPVLEGKETSINQKTVSRVWVDVYETPTFQAGPDLDNLKTWKSRKVSAGYGPIQELTERAPVALQSGWGPDGTVCIRVSSPLPATILGIIREVNFGGS